MLSGLLEDRYSRLFTPREIYRLGEKLPQSIRVNTLRADEEELVERLEARGVRLKKISWVKHGYRVERSAVPIGATPEYLLGHYFIQDLASMAACEALSPEAEEAVLDMAASPGGKSTYLCQLMENEGCIVAIELNKRRLRGLKSNIMRMGCRNVIVLHMDASKVLSLNISYDKVLLDAPCTGTGVAHRSRDALLKTRMELRACTPMQERLLEAGLKVLKSGGSLVYSTCSLLPEENEFIVDRALGKYEVAMEKVEAGERAMTEPYGTELREELGKAARFYPWKHSTQGFFIAKLRKP